MGIVIADRVEFDPLRVVFPSHGIEPLRPLGLQFAGQGIGFAEVAGLERAAHCPGLAIEAMEQVSGGAENERPDGGIGAAGHAREGVTAVSVTRQCYTVFLKRPAAKSLSGHKIQT